MVDPYPPLDGPVADSLVAGEDDQSTGTDDGQPLVVEAAPRDLGQIGWPGKTTSPCRSASALPRARSFSSTKNLAATTGYAASDRNCSS
jgi:hypothetical protein